MHSVLAAALSYAPRCAPPAASATATAALSPFEAAKLFGRFAEPVLFLDREVGACCHSACSDCEWREPGGGYRWDVMRSTVPKWLPCYLGRDFADERGEHTPRWAAALFPDGAASAPIGRAEFGERFASVEWVAMPMGPKGAVKADAAEPAAEALDALWGFLCEGADELGPAACVARLQDMNVEEDREGAIGEGPDQVDWKSFARALGVAPFERW